MIELGILLAVLAAFAVYIWRISARHKAEIQKSKAHIAQLHLELKEVWEERCKWGKELFVKEQHLQLAAARIAKAERELDETRQRERLLLFRLDIGGRGTPTEPLPQRGMARAAEVEILQPENPASTDAVSTLGELYDE